MSQFDLESSVDLDEFRSSLLLLARLHLGTRLQKKLDGSDIVQETFLEAHINRDQFRGQTKAEVFAWLRQMLTNNIIDAVRKFGAAKRNHEREVSWERRIQNSALRVESWLQDERSSPHQRSVRNEQLEKLAEALSKLPDSQRQAIELFYLQGCSLREVSQLMNRSVSAVAGLLHRGLKQLRAILERDANCSRRDPLDSQNPSDDDTSLND